MNNQKRLPEIRLSEPLSKELKILIYIFVGAMIGMLIKLLLLEPLEIGFQNLISILQNKPPLLLKNIKPKIFTLQRGLSIIIIGFIYGGILGYLFYLLRKHHYDLKTYHRDFELQVAALRHHYKNLAVGILGFSQRVKEKADKVYDPVSRITQQNCDPPNFITELEKLRHSAGILEDTAQRLSQALKKELIFLKALTVKNPKLESTDFYPFLIDCIQDLLELRFHDREIQVEINKQPFRDCRDSLEFPFEPNAMEVMCQNLLSNAMTYGDYIDVRVKAENNRVRLEVHDNGPGIEVEKLKHTLYAPAEAMKSESTQLGLRVTIHLLAKFGGDLIVQSEPGAGSTFILEFPLPQ